jgi:predicted MFS family arabinose efflux permease
MSGARAPSAATDWTTVVLMALGFGLVGIDRFMISTLYPVIAKDLHLGYADIGAITGALALAWGVAALFMGNLADRVGRRLVLAGALAVFALLIGASGLATSLGGLILVRVVMGFADGAYTPASIAATLDAAPPRRHGLVIGIQQMMLPVCGLGLAPLAVSAMLHLMNWRWTFVAFALPGLILAALVWRKLPRAAASPRPGESLLTQWRLVIGYRNVRLGMVLMLCWLTCLITTSALLPSYLIDYLKLSFGQMSGVISAIGIGSAVGTVLLAWLSDRIGRKAVMLLSSAGACVSLLLLSRIGPAPALLFAALFAVHFFNNAAITMTVGPICAEAVPAGLMATASGVVIASGELLGGGLAPFAAGHFAARFGIEHVLWLPIGALAAAFLLSLLLIETRAHPAS